ncbi:MAG TPA: M23 family metallopeptidase [Edaphocola sp.]|nr:M23 family metallopeptidase [Edaphocola sp.]
MYLKTVSLFALLLMAFLPVNAQNAGDFPTGYFRDPLDVPILLAGGYGECRPDHFHTGIDMKTQGRENLPVHAAADGYIVRISISSTGYGNCLYIAHPNGYTTVYGHLNDFYPELQQWMIAQQYAQQKWAIQLFPDPGQFPVKKGQVIAWSGTTGGSTGPHLHFEIRNTATEHVLNGELFGLPIKDTRAPKAMAVAIYNGGTSIYMQSPAIEQLINAGHDQFRPKAALVKTAYPLVFMGIHAEDYMEGSSNWMGIYQMKLYMDDQLQAATLFRELDFGLSRYANAYADYKTKKNKGVWYQGLYKLPNNQLKVYPFMNDRDGKLDLSDGGKHHIRIELFDAFGNKSTVNFDIQYQAAGQASETLCGNGQLWDCREAHRYADSDFRFSSGAQSFYDDVCFQIRKNIQEAALSESVQVMDADIPVQEACHIGLKLNRVVPDSLQSKVAFVHHVQPTRLPGNNPQTGTAAAYEDGWATASVRTLGNYYAVIDTVPPKIIAYQSSGTFKAGQPVRFKATDDLTSVTSFEGYLDGRWLRFVRTGDTYTYKIDDHCPDGTHTLEVRAVDENNNESVYRMQIKKG